jgi:hypothetical protein
LSTLGGGASKSQPIRVPGQPFYLGERKLAVPTCRDGVVAATEALVVSGEEPVFTVEMVHETMVTCGTHWPRATTMLRMTRPARRPPYTRLVRLATDRYQVVEPGDAGGGALNSKPVSTHR